MEESFNNLLNSFKNMNYCFDLIYNSNLKKELLVVCLCDAEKSVVIFDSKNNAAVMVGEINYKLTNNFCFITNFEVNINYQKNGLGKFLINFALAHAEVNNVKNAFGYSAPINNFKGITEKNPINQYFEEKNTLNKIYQNLGFNLKKTIDGDTMFSCELKDRTNYNKLNLKTANLLKSYQNSLLKVK